MIIAHENPSTQYEASIYVAVPVAFWAFVSAAVASSLGLSIFETLSRERFRKWPLGPFLMLPAMALVQSLPLLRGYYVYGRNDLLTYIGLTLNIETSGHLTPDNF